MPRVAQSSPSSCYYCQQEPLVLPASSFGVQSNSWAEDSRARAAELAELISQLLLLIFFGPRSLRWRCKAVQDRLPELLGHCRIGCVMFKCAALMQSMRLVQCCQLD